MTDSTAPAVAAATHVPHQNLVGTAQEIEQARRRLNDLLMLQGERLARAGDFVGSDQCLALVDMTKIDGPIGTFASRWTS